jgi:large subunit ribosomal protein L5
VAEEKKSKREKREKKEKPEEKDSGVSPPVEKGYRARLSLQYKQEILPALQKRFGYKNLLEVPRLKKIVVNMGLGDGLKDAKLMDAAVDDLMVITGQRPAIARARKSVASFKVRKGMAIGCKVTLRGTRMYEFFDRLVNVAIPRIRDFRGLSADSFDGHGNYTFGIREQIVFPEIDYDKVIKIRGMDITMNTTARTDEEAFELLKALGVPFRVG